MINRNLKIDDCIYDKATIAAAGNDISTHRTWAPYSLFQDQITFVASYGGSVTPTWTFARIAVDPIPPLLNATRTKTNTDYNSWRVVNHGDSYIAGDFGQRSGSPAQ
jgi:hypothetical protein